MTTTDPYAVLREPALADGFDLVVDLDASRGATLVDARDGRAYLDMFTFFASLPLGMNHPGLTGDPDFDAELLRAARCKPSNHDVYTAEAARFVSTFTRVVGDPDLPHLFFIDGGALAVENALKVAFDWKSRRNEAAGRSPELGTQVVHLRHAFHGRSGYTLSLTDTDPAKTARFPRFPWPRVTSPSDPATQRASLAEIEAAFAAHEHDVAAFLFEPIQCEGGDRHLPVGYLHEVEQLCLRYDVLLVADEVQTGFGATGTSWACQQLGVHPDVIAFGKKAQICGVMAGRRVDLVPDNVFRVPSRISSTWGGSLVDMVRSRRILEVIEEDKLIPRAGELGALLLNELAGLRARHPDVLHSPRGRGLLVAVSLSDPALRDGLLSRARTEAALLVLPCGTDGIRFRPPLSVTATELTDAVARLESVLPGGRAGVSLPV